VFPGFAGDPVTQLFSYIFHRIDEFPSSRFNVTLIAS